ncbi:MAG: hypothetical protein EON54_20645 [Alcaligenaceae bacterium]|jgi:hypothetical protein|nr:MAG: hypothetical protein EON54_20645 [Alcaligenaceae bacterium]
MENAAAAIAASGFVTGLFFRLRALLFSVLALATGSVVFSLVNGLSLTTSVLSLLVAQAIFQFCYFLGLTTRAAIAKR